MKIYQKLHTNIFEKYNINDLTFFSFQKLTTHFYNNYEFILKMLTLRVKNPKNLKKMKIYMLLDFYN